MTIPNAHDKVVQLIRMKGPVMPSQINKEIDTNIMFASAILSELVDKKVLRISSLKVGGSPLYYAPGQEYKLQQYADKLHPREKEAYDLLRQKRILRDDRQQPVVRAALRAIKDFAKPLQVTIEGTTHIFWKWYLLSNDDASSEIKQMMHIPETKRPAEVRKHEPEVKREEPKAAHRPESRAEPKQIPKAAERKPVPKGEVQKELASKEKDIPAAAEEPKDRFFRKVKKYFDDSSITMLDFKLIRKESDLEFTVKIPSTVGTLNYFCKAKNKKKISDGDLSSVYINAQSKKMPVLFLTTGELTKKAESLLEKEFRNMSVKKI